MGKVMKRYPSKPQKLRWHYLMIAVMRFEAFLIRDGERERENNKYKSGSVAAGYISTTLLCIKLKQQVFFLAICVDICIDICVRIVWI